jgi:hypothetical protein
LDTNATKGHYECKNNKKVCVIDECDYKAHYLDSAKNKCIAKSTVKCADDEKVDNAGKCQKNIKVGPMNNCDLEMTQDDINRDNCIRGQDKKHSKWENNKCVYKKYVSLQGISVCTVCKFNKYHINQIVKTMEMYKTGFDEYGNEVDINNVETMKNTPVVRLWNQYLADPSICNVEF